VDEIYRMLGREHEADLEREALKFRRAAEVRGSRGDSAKSPDAIRVRAVFVGMLLLLAALPLIVAGCGSASAAKAVSGAHTTAGVIRATERQRLRVLPAHDLVRASRLHASDFEPCARYRGQS
jgi:hypothetical protein